MNPQNQQPNGERKFPNIEFEIPQTPKNESPSSPNPYPWQRLWQQIQDGYNQLPSSGKAIAALGAIAVGLSLLSTVLKLLSAVIGIGFFGLILYAAYKFFIASQSSQS